MGLWDSLNISPELKNMLGEIGAAAAPVILSEVMGNGSQGGLTAIVNKLEQAGFGNQVKSWIGTGENVPITADELHQVLGNEKVKELAARFHVPVDQVGPILAQLLPPAVDHASPKGTLPHTA